MKILYTTCINFNIDILNLPVNVSVGVRNLEILAQYKHIDIHPFMFLLVNYFPF